MYVDSTMFPVHNHPSSFLKYGTQNPDVFHRLHHFWLVLYPDINYTVLLR